jgi:hypothetical protein
MPYVTSASTNQSSSEFWLDVTRLSPADGNVIAAFFSTLFRLSASSFHHDSYRNASAQVEVRIEALIIISRSLDNPGFFFRLRDLHSNNKRNRRKRKTFSSKTPTWIELLPLSFYSACDMLVLVLFFYLVQSQTCECFLSLYIYLVVDNTRQHSAFCLFLHA